MIYTEGGISQRNLAFRRAMKAKKNKRLRRIILSDSSGYNPQRGYIDYGYVNNKWVPVGTHIKYAKNSNRQRFWKKYSNRVVRRRTLSTKGNDYRKVFDYWWTLY